jgi:small-conductance mechanosensitive channel
MTSLNLVYGTEYCQVGELTVTDGDDVAAELASLQEEHGKDRKRHLKDVERTLEQREDKAATATRTAATIREHLEHNEEDLNTAATHRDRITDAVNEIQSNNAELAASFLKYSRHNDKYHILDQMDEDDIDTLQGRAEDVLETADAAKIGVFYPVEHLDWDRFLTFLYPQPDNYQKRDVIVAPTSAYDAAYQEKEEAYEDAAADVVNRLQDNDAGETREDGGDSDDIMFV